MTTAFRPLAGLAAALALTLAACGGTTPAASDGASPQAPPAAGMCAPGVTDCVDTVVDGEGDAGGDERIMAPDIPVVAGFDEGDPEIVTPEPGRAFEAAPVLLESAVVDGDRVVVAFWGGVDPCFVTDTLEVVESDTEVVVTLTAGPAGDPATISCIAIAQLYGVQIQLDAPLGDRLLLDGSRFGATDDTY
jgi:hypothetical protein